MYWLLLVLRLGVVFCLGCSLLVVCVGFVLYSWFIRCVFLLVFWIVVFSGRWVG